MFLENTQTIPDQDATMSGSVIAKTSTKRRVDTLIAWRKYTEDVLREWVSLRYIDPLSKKKVSWEEILLSCLYWAKSSWKAFQEHGNQLKKCPWMLHYGKALSAPLGTIDRFLKKSETIYWGFPQLCLDFGVINDADCKKMDNLGFLNAHGLQIWCHEWYTDPLSGERIHGRELLERFYISGDFWKKLSQYQKDMPTETARAMGGKFPGSKKGILTRIGW